MSGYDYTRVPSKWAPKIVYPDGGGSSLGVHASDTSPWTTDLRGYQIVAVCGISAFPPAVAKRICQLLQDGRIPPAMRLVPIPAPTCICGFPPGDHAPNCFQVQNG